MNKKLFKEISNYFNEDLVLVENEMKSLFLSDLKSFNSPLNAKTASYLPSLNPEFQKEVLNFLFSKSKRLRPLTVLLIKDLFKFEDKDKKLIKLAAALELLHNATLVHDDIIDEAQIRRLNPTFNYKYNSKLAVILGDYLLALSLKLLSKIGSITVFSYFSDNTLNICNGEINQFFSRGSVLKMEEYIEKSKNKTSSLFLAGAKSALHLINETKPLEKKHCETVLDFILNFSLGFQIYDDILNFKSDFENSDNKRAEKISSDIKNGIYTLPYLYMSQQNLLYDIINLNKSSKTYSLVLEFSEDYLNNILNKAQKSIEQLKNVYNVKYFIDFTKVFKN